MEQEKELEWLQELKQKAKPEWLELLDNPSGVVVLTNELPSSFPAEKVAEYGTDERRVWELIGLFYRARRQWFDAIAIYSSMYNHFLSYQLETVSRVHKGMPLVWLADCYDALGFNSLSKRFLMLTLVEDALLMNGIVDPAEAGSYFRLAWRHGLIDAELKRYASKAYELGSQHPIEALFPEWILQELDQNWLIEIPTPNETAFYVANTIYVRHQLSGLGEPTGKALEKLAEYLLSCMPGCRTMRRQNSYSTDYDIVCSIEGSEVDFRSEFGRYFVCECKDWSNSVDFSSFAKFCRVLDSVKARFGILFAKKDISGVGKTTDAEREQLKVFQNRGMVIVIIDQNDLEYVGDGGNFIGLLRAKYEKVRLDIRRKE